MRNCVTSNASASADPTPSEPPSFARGGKEVFPLELKFFSPMPLRLFNTLSGKIEDFRPLQDNQVRMYACGPTVYDYGHIGNFRTFVAVDILRRFLRQGGFKLQHVMNITDVDDKIIRNAARDKKTVQEYTRTYEEAFLEDMGSLNLQRPEKMVRATEHIREMAEFIAVLEKKGIAYRTEDGSYYFRIAKFPEYGKL